MENLAALHNLLYHKDLHPYYFGLGFIQLKINPYQRYHFYHSNLSPILNIEEEVHNHRYSFDSTVLLGKITNKLYSFSPDNQGEFILENESCNEAIKIDNVQPIRGFLDLVSTIEISAGETYHMDYSALHTVSSSQCITRLERTDYQQQFAQVVRHGNATKICPFSSKLPEAQCWAIIKEMITKNDNL